MPVTAATLTKIICLAWAAYGRGQLDESECSERARLVTEAADRYGVDAVLMVAIDVQECDLREGVSAPIYGLRRGRRVVVGYDHCPMGVRVVGRGTKPDSAELYDLAAKKLARWQRWCAAGHPGGKYKGIGPHHYVAHYNPGNRVYANQVMAFYARLRGRAVRPTDAALLTPRSTEIVRRLGKAWQRPGGES